MIDMSYSRLNPNKHVSFMFQTWYKFNLSLIAIYFLQCLLSARVSSSQVNLIQTEDDKFYQLYVLCSYVTIFWENSIKLCIHSSQCWHLITMVSSLQRGHEHKDKWWKVSVQIEIEFVPRYWSSVDIKSHCECHS